MIKRWLLRWILPLEVRYVTYFPPIGILVVECEFPISYEACIKLKAELIHLKHQGIVKDIVIVDHGMRLKLL